MSRVDMIAGEKPLVFDFCEDSDEAEHVRVWRCQHGFTTLAVLGGSAVDAIEVTRDAARKLHPRLLYHSTERLWVVISVRGAAPPKISMKSD